MTVNDIIKDGFDITSKVEMYSNDFSSKGLLKSMGKAIEGSSDKLSEINPDIGVVLGDRYEILAFAQSCMMLNIPIAHIHGGEATEGLIDDSIRHAVTKMSHLHFTASKLYKERLIKMGENPALVFNYGSPGIDRFNVI